MKILEVSIGEEQAGQRLDRALADLIPDFSRARVQALIEDGCVRREGQVLTSASCKVKTDQTFEITVPPATPATPQPEDIPLDVVYEDDDLLVLNKPVGLVVHPAAGNHDGTLVNALLAHCGDSLSGIGGVKRPGIVHRLDKDTSGLMLVAKNDAAHKGLAAQLEDRSVSRSYQAIVWGVPSPKQQRIETQLGRHKTNRKKMSILGEGQGKLAITNIALETQFGLFASVVRCKLETGRTHQIRVHMAHIRHWLIGDALYGRPTIAKALRLEKNISDSVKTAVQNFPRQALHAAEIAFRHPIQKKNMVFTAELPEDMQALIIALEQTRGV